MQLSHLSNGLCVGYFNIKEEFGIVTLLEEGCDRTAAPPSLALKSPRDPQFCFVSPHPPPLTLLDEIAATKVNSKLSSRAEEKCSNMSPDNSGSSGLVRGDVVSKCCWPCRDCVGSLASSSHWSKRNFPCYADPAGNGVHPRAVQHCAPLCPHSATRSPS